MEESTLSESEKIEVVRGRLDEAGAEQLLGFWARHQALAEPEARERLEQAVCVLRDEHGEIVGTNSVYAEDVGLLGGRRFWLYRSFAPGIGDQGWLAMLGAARQALEVEFGAGGGGPIGICLLISDPELLERHPEAVWTESGMVYAGYAPDGTQVRVGYFKDARI